MLRVAVIGVGTMGKQHARVYTEIPGVELVAVADPDEDRTAEIVRRYKVKAYADYREMLRRERPDAVSIAAPSSGARKGTSPNRTGAMVAALARAG
jgi:UDP-N-acetylglucosamine 3-dehydrogenase